MDVVAMVLFGHVNKKLVALINKAGATAIGLSRTDGRLLIARPSPNSEKLGLVGEIVSVDPSALRPLIDNYHIPVIASVAAHGVGQMYNVNADTAVGSWQRQWGLRSGMIPKVNCCVRSLAQGVRTTSIIDGRLEHSLLLEILRDEGAGTMITG
ncbi:hypothetical protein RJ640_007359 [Escallonia rubra]|uniref:Aspartate/glutamate/uridylate kinase domain-containing protein n=1 Tax=Escallonia rubra TaxID=112253 RepID=A0AA88UWD8_9ASTE|nr:hypothetical protein RJ640_007359 [Escallonia rubra]